MVQVTASEMKFEPAAITVPAGETTFQVRNGGTVIHEFEVFSGETLVDEVEDIVPGQTKDLTVNLETGEYTFVCMEPGHEEAGMKGTLTVTEE